MHQYAHDSDVDSAARRSSNVQPRGDRICQLKFFNRRSTKYIASVCI